MILGSVRDLLSILPDAEFRGDASALRRKVRGLETDSRSLTKGFAFVALRGERFDGHEYVPEAFRHGAPVAVVSRVWSRSRVARQVADPLVIVDDPLAAYGRIARSHRDSFDIPVIAIAGSNGKTTTKELLADLLSLRWKVLKTEGNLNNRIGAPAMLLRLRPDHQMAVIEIGTNSPGEIALLCDIVNPTHGLITSIGREHLELLGSIEGVAREEGELFRYLEEHGGWAIVNSDDPFIAAMKIRRDRRLTYGMKGRVDIRGRAGKVDRWGAPRLEIVDRRLLRKSRIDVPLATPGRHSALNALAAAAAARLLGLPMTQVKKGLRSFSPAVSSHGYGRLAPMTAACGAAILNDTYNANPDSTIVALETLASITPAPGGMRIAVLGDMLELGRSSAAEHRRIADEIVRIGGIDQTLFHGPEMKHAWRRLARLSRERNVRPPLHFEEKERLIDAVLAFLSIDDVLLVKGSRGMRMEEVVTAAIMPVDESEEERRVQRPGKRG